MVKGSAARVGIVCILMCIINLALHNDAMCQQKLPDVRPTGPATACLTGGTGMYICTDHEKTKRDRSLSLMNLGLEKHHVGVALEGYASEAG